MVFAKSVFQSVLDRLQTEDPNDGPQETAAFRVSGLNSGFVVEGSSHNTAAFHPEAAYLDLAGDPVPEEPAPADEPAAAEEPQLPGHLARLQPAEIAEDLALSAADTIPTLAEKRRAFARANHPDGVHEAFRDNATQRMTIANQLIDEAIRRLERAKPR